MCGKNCGCSPSGGVPWRLLLLAVAAAVVLGWAASLGHVLLVAGLAAAAVAAACAVMGWVTVRLVLYGSVRRPRRAAAVAAGSSPRALPAGAVLAIEPTRIIPAAVVAAGASAARRG